MAFLFTVIGVLLVLEGIPYFAFPAKAKQWALMIQEVPERTLRILGLLSMVSGLILLFVIKVILK